MSYVTYTTEALVCGGRVNNTSDKSLLLYTEEAGMLWTSARSLREERSKQRYALQDFSLVRVSLVKGKTGWRVGSATSFKNYYKTAATRESRGGVVAVVKLLRQFIHGEEATPIIYADTKQALEAIVDAAPEQVSLYQDLYTYRLLYQLGYIAKDELSEALTDEEIWQSAIQPLSTRQEEAIKNAIAVSHL